MEQNSSWAGKTFLIIVGIIIVAFGAWWLVSKNKTATPSVPTAAIEPIKIGVLLPLTGDSGTSGEKMYQGIKLASKEFPTGIDLVVEDTHSKVADAVSAASKLVNVDKVDVIIGPYIPEETIAVAPIASQKNITLFSGSFCSDAYKNVTNVFCGYPSSNKQLETVIPEIKKNNVRSIALVNTNDDFGLSSRATMKNMSGSGGYNVVYDELVQPGAKDLSTVASKVMFSGADGVFIATGDTAQAFTLMKYLYQRGYKGMRITFIDVDTKYLKEFGNAAEGTYAPGIAPSNFSEDYNKKYEAEYGKKPDDYLPASGYDIFRLVVGAYYAKGNNDVSTSAISYDYKNPAIGHFKYLPDHTVLFDMQLWKAVSGNYVPVE